MVSLLSRYYLIMFCPFSPKIIDYYTVSAKGGGSAFKSVHNLLNTIMEVSGISFLIHIFPYHWHFQWAPLINLSSALTMVDMLTSTLDLLHLSPCCNLAASRSQLSSRQKTGPISGAAVVHLSRSCLVEGACLEIPFHMGRISALQAAYCVHTFRRTSRLLIMFLQNSCAYSLWKIPFRFFLHRIFTSVHLFIFKRSVIYYYT